MIVRQFGTDELRKGGFGQAVDEWESGEQRMRAALTSPMTELGRGILSGTDVAQAKLYDTAALAGQFFGLPGVVEWGTKGYERNIAESQENPPAVPDITKAPSLREKLLWAAGQAGQQGPQFVGTLAGAGAGALAGTAVGLPLAGAMVGGGLTSFTQNQNFGELVKQGVPPEEAAKVATAVGVPSALLDTVLQAKLTMAAIKAIGSTATKQGGKEFVTRLVTKLLSDTGIEGGTEVGQELIAMAGESYANRDNPNFELTSDEISRRLVNVGAAGGLLGALGGAVEAVPGPAKAPSVETPPGGTAPPVAPPTTPQPPAAPALTPGQTPRIGPQPSETGIGLGINYAPPFQEVQAVDAALQAQAAGNITPDQATLLAASRANYPLWWRDVKGEQVPVGVTAAPAATERPQDATQAGQITESRVSQYRGTPPVVQAQGQPGNVPTEVAQEGQGAGGGNRVQQGRIVAAQALATRLASKPAPATPEGQAAAFWNTPALPDGRRWMLGIPPGQPLPEGTETLAFDQLSAEQKRTVVDNFSKRRGIVARAVTGAIPTPAIAPAAPITQPQTTPEGGGISAEEMQREEGQKVAAEAAAVTPTTTPTAVAPVTTAAVVDIKPADIELAQILQAPATPESTQVDVGSLKQGDVVVIGGKNIAVVGRIGGKQRFKFTEFAVENPDGTYGLSSLPVNSKLNITGEVVRGTKATREGIGLIAGTERAKRAREHLQKAATEVSSFPGSMFTPKTLWALAIRGAEILENVTTDFAAWVKEMIYAVPWLNRVKFKSEEAKAAFLAGLFDEARKELASRAYSTARAKFETEAGRQSALDAEAAVRASRAAREIDKDLRKISVKTGLELPTFNEKTHGNAYLRLAVTGEQILEQAPKNFKSWTDKLKAAAPWLDSIAFESKDHELAFFVNIYNMAKEQVDVKVKNTSENLTEGEKEYAKAERQRLQRKAAEKASKKPEIDTKEVKKAFEPKNAFETSVVEVIPTDLVSEIRRIELMPDGSARVTFEPDILKETEPDREVVAPKTYAKYKALSDALYDIGFFPHGRSWVYDPTSKLREREAAAIEKPAKGKAAPKVSLASVLRMSQDELNDFLGSTSREQWEKEAQEVLTMPASDLADKLRKIEIGGHTEFGNVRIQLERIASLLKEYDVKERERTPLLHDSRAGPATNLVRRAFSARPDPAKKLGLVRILDRIRQRVAAIVLVTRKQRADAAQFYTTPIIAKVTSADDLDAGSRNAGDAVIPAENDELKKLSNTQLLTMLGIGWRRDERQSGATHRLLAVRIPVAGEEGSKIHLVPLYKAETTGKQGLSWMVKDPTAVTKTGEPSNKAGREIDRFKEEHPDAVILASYLTKAPRDIANFTQSFDTDRQWKEWHQALYDETTRVEAEYAALVRAYAETREGEWDAQAWESEIDDKLAREAASVVDPSQTVPGTEIPQIVKEKFAKLFETDEETKAPHAAKIMETLRQDPIFSALNERQFGWLFQALGYYNAQPKHEGSYGLRVVEAAKDGLERLGVYESVYAKLAAKGLLDHINPEMAPYQGALDKNGNRIRLIPMSYTQRRQRVWLEIARILEDAYAKHGQDFAGFRSSLETSDVVGRTVERQAAARATPEIVGPPGSLPSTKQPSPVVQAQAAKLATTPDAATEVDVIPPQKWGLPEYPTEEEASRYFQAQIRERPGAQARYTTDIKDPSFRLTPEQARNVLFTSLRQLADRGVPINIFQSTIPGLSDKYKGAVEGRRVALVVEDITDPDTLNVVHALHETAHVLFGELDDATQQQIHRAISSLGDDALSIEGFKPELAPGLTPETAALVRSEERLAQSLALKLTQQGVEAIKAGGFAQALWRSLKDMYYRVTMALSKIITGLDTPERALAFFENRMRQLLAGDPSVKDFVSWIGGAWQTPLEQVDLHTPSAGLTSRNFPIFDPDNNLWYYPTVIPESRAAMEFNAFAPGFRATTGEPRMRGEKIPVTPDNPQLNSEVFNIAPNMELLAALHDMWSAWQQTGRVPAGWTFEIYLQSLGIIDPQKQISAELKTFIDRGIPEPNAGAHYRNLPSDFLRQEAARSSILLLDSIQTKILRQRAFAQKQVEKLPNRVNRLTQQYDRLWRNYTDAGTLSTASIEHLTDLLNEFSENIKSQSDLAQEKGAVLQALEALHYKIDEPIRRDYESAINRIWRRFTDTPYKLTEVLESVRRIGDTETIRSMSADTIRDRIWELAQNDEALAPLIEDTPDGHNLLATIVAFLRTNETVMDLLQAKSDELSATERLEIEGSLAKVTDDTNQTFSDVRKEFKQVIKHEKLAERLFQSFKRKKSELKRATESLDRAKRELQAIDVGLKPLQKHINDAENYVGYTELGDVTLVDDEEFLDPKSVTATDKEIRDGDRWKYKTSLTKEQIDAYRKRARPWLVANADRKGAVWARIQRQVQALEDDIVANEDIVRRTSTPIWFLSDHGQRLVRSGIEDGRRANRMMRDYSRIMETWGKRLHDIGARWTNVRKKALKLSGIKREGYFEEAVFQAGCGFLQDNAVELSVARNTDEILQKLRRFFDSNPGTRSVSQGDAWLATRRMFELAVEINDMRLKAHTEAGLSVEDELNGRHLFRAPSKVNGLLRMPRHLRREFTHTFQRMRDLGWINKPFDRAKVGQAMSAANAQQNAQDALQTLYRSVGSMFTPEIWRDFVRPLARKQGTAVFPAPSWSNGTRPLVAIEDAVQAESQSGGDIFNFIRNLHELSARRYGTLQSESVDQYGLQILGTLQDYYNSIEKDHERIQKPLSATKWSPPGQPHTMMDARKSDSYPGEWLQYARFTQQDNQFFLQEIAYHGAFGIDGENMLNAMNSVIRHYENLASSYEKILESAVARNPKDRQEELKFQQEESKSAGVDFKEAQDAHRMLDQIRALPSQFNAMFGPRTGHRGNASVGQEVIGAVTGGVIQGLKTVILNTTSMFDFIARFGASRASMGMIKDAWKEFTRQGLGTFYEILGSEVGLRYELDKILKQRGYDLPLRDDAFLNAGYVVDSGMTMAEKMAAEPAALTSQMQVDLGRESALARRTRAAARWVTALGQTRGKFRIEPGKGRFAEFQPARPFNMIQAWMHRAVIYAMWKRSMYALADAIEYYKPLVRAGATLPQSVDAGPLRRLTKMSDETFARFKEMLQRNGIDLERLAIQRATEQLSNPDAQKVLFTNEQMQSIASAAMNEIILDSTVANTPWWFYGIPLVRAVMPLLGWLTRKTHQLNQIFTPAETGAYLKNGKLNKRLMLNGMKILLATAPVSLAYAVMADWFDEELLGKKSTRRSLGEFQGAGGALTALIENVDMLGQLGWYGTLGNWMANGFAAGDVRSLSMDQRIVGLKAIYGTIGALSTLINQNFTPTYSTVTRPLMMSWGGGGYLQLLDILNAQLARVGVEPDIPLVAQERELVRKINAENYLRAAGRAAGMDVRLARSGQISMPNPIKPYVGEMAIAAISNDPVRFREAYNLAVQEAAKEGKPDPEEYVVNSFEYRHPLRSVFKTVPRESEVNALLAQLSDHARTDVKDALRLFNHYSVQIGGKAFAGTKAKEKTGLNAGLSAYRSNLNPLRSRSIAFSF